jgi:hypothetical protein
MKARKQCIYVNVKRATLHDFPVIIIIYLEGNIFCNLQTEKTGKTFRHKLNIIVFQLQGEKLQ